ncbi:death-associated protein kinase 1-like [Saccoglossus kowalevskii]
MAEGESDWIHHDEFSNAAHLGDCKILKEWLDRGHNVDTRYYTWKTTALIEAAQFNHCSAIILLLKHKAGINYQDEHGNTALLWACWNNSLDAGKLLLSKSADVNLRNKDSHNALFKILHPSTYLNPIKTAEDKYKALEFIMLLLNNGVDMTSTDKNGLTPIQFVKSKIGTGSDIRNQYYKEAELLLQKVKDERDNIDLLKKPGVLMDTVKLYILGHGGTGKTTLKNSLSGKTGVVPTLLRKLVRESGPPPGTEVHHKTPGISISDLKISGKRFNSWDFAGQSEFFVSHSMFLNDEDAICIILYNIADSTGTSHIIRPRDLMETSLQQATQWCQMMKVTNKSCLPDDLESRLTVILVASKADWAKLEHCEEEAREVAEYIKQKLFERFGKCLDIEDVILILDCHDTNSAGMKQLRKILTTKRKEKIKKLMYMPNICAEILKMLNTWFEQRKMFPVMYWNEYIECIKKEISSDLEDDFLIKATGFLHRIGMVLYIKSRISPESQDIVILAPKWLCSEILGPIFASKDFSQFAHKLERKQIYTKEDIQRVLDGNVVVDIVLLINLLREFEILFPLKDGDYGVGHQDEFIIPCRLPSVMPKDQWLLKTNMHIYVGRRVECRSIADIFSDNFFPQLQTRLHVKFTALGRPPSGIWKDGIKVCKGVEGLVQLTSNGRAVNVVVRCERKEEIGDCFEVMEIVSYEIQQVLHSACPGTEVDRYVLSAESLRSNEKLEDVCYYTLDEIREAEEKKTNVYHKKAGKEEKVTDLIVPGFDKTFLNEKGHKCDVKWMPYETRQEVIKHLEPEDPMWQDHRIMAQYMGIGHEDRKLFAAQAKTRGQYVTELFLAEWSARWEAKVRQDGDKAVKYEEKKGFGSIYYESNIENLLKINNKYLHHHAVTVVLENAFKKLE